MAVPYKLLAPQDVLEAYYSNVQRSETIHMVMLDTDGLIVATNRATARLFGKTPDELIGQSWFELAIASAERNMRRTEYLRILATGLPEVSQHDIALPDGSLRTMLWSNSLMHAGDKLTGVVSFGIDITERARALEELKLEQHLLQRTEEIAGLGTYILDAKSGVWTSSAVLDRIFGITDVYPRTVQTWLDLVHPDDRAAMADYFNSHVLMQHQSFDRTYRTMRKSDGATRIVHGFGELDIAPDGSVLRMVGTIQDITDQAHISQDLLESEARFRELVQHSPDAIVILDADSGKFLVANPRAEELFGTPIKELLTIGPVDVSPPVQPDGRPSDIAAREYIQQTINGKETSFRWMHRTKQGVDKLCLIRLVSLPSHERHLIRGSMTDISAENQAHIRLEESERLYHTLIELSPDAIGIHRDGKFLYSNAAGLAMMGVEKLDDIIGRSVFDFEAPEARELAATRISSASQGQPTAPVETTFLKADGTRYDVEVRSIPFVYRGAPAILSIVRDITVSKREEAMYRALIEDSDVMVSVFSAEGKRTYISPNTLRITGYTPEEYPDIPNLGIVHPEDLETAKRLLAELSKPGASVHGQRLRIRRKDGVVRQIEVDARNAADVPGINGLVISLRDVTEREELKERYRMLFNNMTDGFAYCQMIYTNGRAVDFRYVDVNPQFEILTGIKGAAGRQFTELLPGVRESNPEIIETYAKVVETGISTTLETESPKFGGRLLVHVYRPEPGYFAAVFENISERANAERLVRESQERFELAARNTGNIVYDWDIAKNAKSQWQGAIEEVTGFTAEEYNALTNDEWYALVHPDDLPSALKQLEASQKAGSPYSYQYRLRRKDGTYIPVEDSGSFIRDVKGVSVRMVGAIRDISARMEAEQALVAASKQMRAILEKTPEDIIVVSPDGTCTYTNNSGMLGYTPAEIVGVNQLHLIHPDDMNLVTQKLQEIQNTSQATLKATYRLRHKNGSWRTVDATGINLLRDPAIGGILIFSRDVTDVEKGKAAILRVDELESLNKAMIGRELRIAQLKEEVTILRAKLEDVKQ